MNLDDELQSLFDKFSISVSKQDPLPTKARRFILNMFQEGDVPKQEWFNELIPLDDPYGTTLYSLADLEMVAGAYRPESPRNIWDMLPLHLRIIMSLISGCVYHQQSLAHSTQCQGCEVCERSEHLSMLMATDSHFKAWNEIYGEEVGQEYGDVGNHENVPVVGREALKDVKQRLDAVQLAGPARVHYAPEYDSSEWDLDPSRM